MTDNIGENMRRVWSRDLHNLVSGIRDGTFKYEEKPKKSIDWSSYNEAQLNELADMLKIIKDSVDIAAHNIRETHTKIKGPGRPRFPNGDVTKALLLQSYFGASDRLAAGLLKVFDSKLGISKDFSYKTIERGYDPERTKEILDEVFRLTNEWSNSNETTFGVDGSGDPTTMKVNYESKRAQQRKEREEKDDSEQMVDAWPSKKKDFQYSVISSGIHTKIIAGFSTSSNHHIGELSHFPEVMRQTYENAPNMKIMLGDPLYANRPVCNLTYYYDVSLYSLPKSNVTLKNKGCRDWSRMLCELILDPQGFLQVYHDRSISETVNSMMKRRELTPIRKRLDCRKDTEECLKINIHNLRQSCYLTYLAPQLTKLQKYQGG
jgi:transposase